MEWIKLSLPWLIPWLLFMTALIAAIRNLVAAERDRRVLQHVSLEKEKLELEIDRLRNDLQQAGLKEEKLELEIGRLRNDPTVIADRRSIYDRLREVLRAMGSADVTREQIRELHTIHHDSNFRFPEEIPNEILALIRSAIAVHVNIKLMRHQRNRPPDDDWAELVEKEGAASQEIASYYEGMVERFKPYVSL